MLAADTFPEWAGAIGVPLWIGGLAFMLWLWLSGRVMLAKDHQAALALERKRADEQVESAELRVADLQNRVEHLVVDRDAWREAHDAEVAARLAAEKAASKLLEASNVSVKLIDALTKALPPHRRGGA